MSIVRKSSGSILQRDGVIRDDANPCRCCKCPPCYEPLPSGYKCRCRATRFLVVINGVTVCTDCYCIEFPNTGPPCEKGKATGAVDGAYCITSGFVYAGPGWETWAGDSPDLTCGPPATRLDDPSLYIVTVTLTFNYTATGVSIRLVVSGVTFGTPTNPVFFDGSLDSTNCDGPWTVTNSSPGCVYDGAITWGAHGGSATIYPCPGGDC